MPPEERFRFIFQYHIDNMAMRINDLLEQYSEQKRKNGEQNRPTNGFSEGLYRSFCSHFYPSGLVSHRIEQKETISRQENKHDAKTQTQMANKLCTICFVRLHDIPVPGETELAQVLTLKCGHMFHQKCFVRWEALSSTCPLCRDQCWTNNQQIHFYFMLYFIFLHYLHSRYCTEQNFLNKFQYHIYTM